jgi:hypothetical protein
MRDLSISVALDAKTHLKSFVHAYTIHIFNITMTLAAINPGLYVSLMAEKYKFLEDVYAIPLNRRLIIIVVTKVCNRRIIYDNFAVTEHTCFKRWYTGNISINRLGMTENAADLFFAGMDAMAERYRLLNAQPARKVVRITDGHKNKYYPCNKRNSN